MNELLIVQIKIKCKNTVYLWYVLCMLFFHKGNFLGVTSYVGGFFANLDDKHFF